MQTVLKVTKDKKVLNTKPDYVKVILDLRKDAESKILESLQKNDYSPNSIAKGAIDSIIADMRQNAKTVLLKMMGFENNFGWSIDHCNGRSGNSAVGDVLKDAFTQMCTKFIEDNTDVLTTLTEKEYTGLITSLHNNYVFSLSNSAQTHARKLGDAHGKELAESLMEKAKGESVLLTAAKLMDLTDLTNGGDKKDDY